MPDPNHGRMMRRAFWAGTISFGLVGIPVALFPGNRSRRAALRMLAPDGTPLRRRYLCPKEGRLVANDEIVRGFETEKDRFVVVSDEELEALEPEKSREIDLRRFVRLEQVDPIYFDRGYFIVPTGDSQKAYRLLVEVMETTGQAGIATFVMRNREYLIAILAENKILRAETLRFAEEIRTPQDVGFAPRREVPDKLVKQMQREMEAIAFSTFDRGMLVDPQAEKILDLVEKKMASGEGIIHPPPEDLEVADEGAEVIDLMDVLKRSIAQGASDQPEARGRVKSGSNPSGRGDKGGLARQTKRALYEKAQQMNLAGRSKMSKAELIEGIRRADG